MITTKRAKSGKSSINYSGSGSFQKPIARPKFVTDGYAYASHFFTAYNAWNNYSSIPSKLNKTQIFTMDWLNEFKRRKEQGITDEITVDDKGNYVYYGNEDYYDVLIKDNTFVQDHNLSVSGNTEKLDYYISGRAYDYNGMYRFNSDKYKTYNTRAKAGLQVNDWLRIANNIDYNYAKYRDPTTGGEGGISGVILRMKDIHLRRYSILMVRLASRRPILWVILSMEKIEPKVKIGISAIPLLLRPNFLTIPCG
ncbi:hypothetical protein KUH03_07990 [Sphingobacterium sp. E70]|uniref:hypothetical protein n=1 Tax=Sphingobacterium sp. E70 TaxID=2853439 RepID=UPI00211C0739|nr:hypothetical protein [Sphingobacterium sp. E70]ULT26762.1 hypothetical protein KUH03_07990 [Sphingobacterium sp. E70]